MIGIGRLVLPSTLFRAYRGTVVRSSPHPTQLCHHRLGSRWFSLLPPRLAAKPSTGQASPSRGQVKHEIRRLLKLARPEYKLLALAFGCIIVTSLVLMSLPLFIGKIIDTAKPLDDGDDEDKDGNKVVTEFAPEEKETVILGLPAHQFYMALGALFTVGALANFGRTYLLRSVGERLVARLRLRLFSKILCQDLYFFDVGPTKLGMKTGDLILRLLADAQIISKTLSGNISDGVRLLISGMVGLLMMCYVLWKLCLCMLAIFPPLIIMLTVYGRRIKKLLRTIQENLGAMTKVTEEKLNGLKTIQLFSQQRAMVHDYNHEIKNIFNLSIYEGKLSGMYNGFNGFLGNVTLISLLVIGTKLIGQGEMTIGDLSSFMMYAVYTGSLVFGLGNFYTELMKGVGAAERIFELKDSKPLITTSLGKKVDDLYGDIALNNVKFAYPLRPNSEVFTNLDLRIRAGENVCLVGPSGSGKSLVLQLLMRFYDPLSGSVTVNGHDILDLNLNFYRSQMGYVQQEPLLFLGTIRDNLTFGKRDATEGELDEAMRLSNSLNFIRDLPQGLDTVIGPLNLTQLSGGQRQRISLARTLIRHPKMLILDEATLALDLISEELVMRNLLMLNRDLGVTIINIAHRLSTIRNSDRVIVFNQQGEVVEDGPFSELYGNPNSELNKLLKNHDLE